MYDLFYTTKGLKIIAAVLIPTIAAFVLFYDATTALFSEAASLATQNWYFLVPFVAAFIIIKLANKRSREGQDDVVSFDEQQLADVGLEETANSASISNRSS